METTFFACASIQKLMDTTRVYAEALRSMRVLVGAWKHASKPKRVPLVHRGTCRWREIKREKAFDTWGIYRVNTNEGRLSTGKVTCISSPKKEYNQVDALLFCLPSEIPLRLSTNYPRRRRPYCPSCHHRLPPLPPQTELLLQRGRR